jgi:hypothetical protein
MNITRKLAKIGVLALCAASICTCIVTLTACGTKQVKITGNDIEVYSYSSTWDKSSALPVTMQEDTLRIDVDANTIDVEFDFAKFFDANPDFIGKNLYITRNDITKGDGTLVKGYAWREVEGGTASTRKYKKLGSEDNEETQAMTKNEIQDLDGREGEIRLYLLNSGACVTYIDASTGSSLETGEKNVTFRIHGNHGKVAVMKVLVNKA